MKNTFSTLISPTFGRLAWGKPTLIFLLLMLFTLPGCLVKSTLKKGAAYESAGMFRDASELYYQASVKKPSSPELKIALKRAGQLFIDDQSDKISQAFNRGDYKTTVYSYLTTKEFIDKVENLGIDLKPDPGMARIYGDAKETYLAQRYEEGQRNITDQKFDDAKQIFAEINKIDPDFRDTRNYLKQATFEPVYQEGARLFGEGKYMEAYSRWKSISDQDKNYHDVAEQMIQALSERYKQGSVSLINENFQEAAIALGEVYRADPAFRDVKQLFTEARNEPVYRQGNSFLGIGKCRTAYFSFDQVVKDAGTYKDAATLREKALACAQYPIAVATADKRGYTSVTNQFQSLIMGQLINQKNLFLKVYDISTIDQRAIYVLVNPAGKFDIQVLQQLGSRQNIRAILYIEFPELYRNEGNLNKDEKTGFERTSSKNSAGEVIYKDQQVKYQEYSQRNSISVTCTYRLVSCESGEVLLSDRISESKSDEIRYAAYSGAKENLYPADAHGGSYTINTGNYRTLQNLLKASKNITSIEKLTEKALTPIGQKISGSINNFNPEK
jgi:tetratricopeptide (TPR) repeat protein